MPIAEAPGAPSGDHTIHVDHRARMEILFAILLGLFLSALDQTIVGTALPTIVTDLHGNDLYTWVVTIYLLTSTISGPVYGKLSDQFGRKRLLMFGIALFLIGSALSGLSQTMEQLIIFRGIQGLGAGALFPISLAVIGDLFSPQERGKYQGLFGAVFGISALIGPALGGFLTDQVSWHWIFFVNIPIGLVALYIIGRLLPAHIQTGVTRAVDYLGVAVFTAALVPILIGLTNAQFSDWTDPFVGGLILLGAIIGVVFLWVETRAKEPIVPLGLFRNRTYSISILATFLASFGFFGAIIFLPRWYQIVAGSSATESGYQLLPLLAGLIIGSILSGQWVSRTGHYKWLTFIALITLTGALYLMTNLHADTPTPVLYTWQFIAGLGIGPTMAVFTIIVQNAVPWQMLGVATSNLTFFRQVGGTVGLAIAGTIFARTLETQAPTQVANQLLAAGVPQSQLEQLQQGFSGAFNLDQITGVGDMGQRILDSIPPQAQQFVAPYIDYIVAGIHEAFSLAIANTMYLSMVATAIAAVSILALREVPLRRTINANSMAAAKPSSTAEATPASVPASAATAGKPEPHTPDTHSPKPATD
ncbi:MAG TPA: MDR family MFS transporter [Candidatus Limnocylindrales bacterium]